MSVGWSTYERLDSPCVSYGLSGTQLISAACSNDSSTYNTARTYFNNVVLTGLQPSTTYYYKINSTNSTVESFLSPRAVGDTTSFNMSVVIDLGVYGENGYTTKKKRDIIHVSPALNQTTIGALARTADEYELVLHPGDFAYADDWYETPSNLLDGANAYEAILENFYYQLAPVASNKPYMASPGNHEAACEEVDFVVDLCPLGQYNFTDFMVRFGNMPEPFPSTSNSTTAQTNAKNASALAIPPFWYSFEYGMAHVVMINTETDYPDSTDGPGTTLDGGNFGFPGQQLEFLEADLASVDRSITPWVILAGHRPWYTTGAADDICEPCQLAFEDIMYKYGVDLALFGHVHNSQRFNPLYQNVTDPAGLNNPKAPMYLVVGGAGNIEGLDAVGANATGNVFAYAEDFSYGNLRFLNRTHLGVDFFQSSTGDLLDSSVLYKAHDVDFVVQ